MKLSVVIPAYNEASNIRKGVLDEVWGYLKNQDYQFEVLVVDDGSKDETADLVATAIKDKPGFRLIRNTHGGKALTVMTGMLQAKGEVVLFTDTDQATPLNQIEYFFPRFDAGYDIVIGKRKGRAGEPLLRKVYAYGFVVLRNLILGLPFADTQCGFKAFNQESLRVVFPVMRGGWEAKKAAGAAVNAGFDIEMLFIARKAGFKITDVPVSWHYVKSERVGLMAGIETLIDIIRIRINGFLGKYDKKLADQK